MANPTAAAAHEVRVLIDEETRVLTVPHGANLRKALLAVDISPYALITTTFNCGGHGICATCGVDFQAGEPEPVHWHDKLARAGDYLRLSCQINVENDMTIRILTDKVIWGKRSNRSRIE